MIRPLTLAAWILFTGSTASGAALARPATTESPAARPADGESLGLVHVINLYEIDLAKFALTRPTSQATRGTAHMLEQEHSQNEKRLAELDVPATITPEVTAMKTKLDKQAARLKALPPDAFEAAYIKAMSDGHQDAKEMLKKRAPIARTASVRTYLIQTEKEIESHYSEIRELEQGAVGK